MVTDEQSAIVSGAKVTLTFERTHGDRTTTTNAAGLYFFNAVDPGSYTISVNEPRFKISRLTGIITELGVTTTPDLKLSVGATGQTTDVSATAEELINSAANTRLKWMSDPITLIYSSTTRIFIVTSSSTSKSASSSQDTPGKLNFYLSAVDELLRRSGTALA
jgi:hypothetical protein